MVVEAIQSVLDQTYHPHEVIVVDDGSTDNTREIVEAFIDSRVRYIYQNNARQAAARNHGIREANGQYIAFLDSDDLYFPDKTEKQIQYLRDHPHIGLIHSGFVRINEKTGEQMTVEAKLSGRPIAEIMTTLEITTPSVIIPRHVFDVVGVFDEALPGVEDMEFWIRVAQRFDIASIPEPLVKIRVNSFNPNRFVKRRLFNTLAVWDKVFRGKPDVSWLEKRKIYARPYYQALFDIYRIYPEIPSDITRWFILATVIKMTYYHPPTMFRGRMIVFGVLFRTFLPKSLYTLLRPLWRKALGISAESR
jgi:glycosyltransferase involved in cell wall biosynthesis